MAPEKQADEQAPAQSEAKPKSRMKPMIVVGVLMLVEGVGIFGMMKFFGSPPESTIAAQDDAAMQDPLNLDKEVEIDICDLEAFNRKEGRLYVYSIKLSAMVDAEDVGKINRFVKARSASINDRIQVVIRSADPQQLNDPSLETIKRQILFELNNLLGGEGLIHSILVAKMLQSRSNL